MSKISNSKVIHLIGVIFLSVMACSASAENWQNSHKKMIEDFAIAGYDELLKRSEALSKNTQIFCATTTPDNVKKVEQGYHDAMDAWQRILLLRLGPSELFMRHFRMEMWPDRSNAAAKQLRKLLSVKDISVLESKRFATASTAVQGLSAYERLLFIKEGKVIQHFTGSEKGRYRCQLLQAISTNTVSISKSLLTEWKGSYYKTLTTAGKDNDYFSTDKEVTSAFLNQLATQLQYVLDKKIKRPLGGEVFKLKRAESWRSGRSIRNIILNLESAKKLFQLGFSSHLTDAVLIKKLNDEFKQTIAAGKLLEMPLKQVHKEKPEALKAWVQQISQLKHTIMVDLPNALDIPLGFNSLDGD